MVKSADYEFAIDTGGKGITSPDTLLASLGRVVLGYTYVGIVREEKLSLANLE